MSLLELRPVCVGPLKLKVSFAKEPYKRDYKGDYILQKRPVIVSSLLIVATSSAQECTDRTLISHEPLMCSKLCFTKTESVQS